MFFWATNVCTVQGKIKICKKNVLSKIKIFSVGENKNKRFNDRVKVILSRKEIKEGQKQKYANVKINGVNKITASHR